METKLISVDGQGANNTEFFPLKLSKQGPYALVTLWQNIIHHAFYDSSYTV